MAELIDGASLHILLLSLVGIFCICIGSESDISCLKSIKDSLEDPHNHLNSYWIFDNYTEDSICKFYGIECWNSGEIYSIGLDNLGLKGQFPRGLENCKSLTVLNLSNNDLQGSLPFDIHKTLPYVVSLDLSFNHFSGKIPPSLAECNFLNFLVLDHNNLSGQIPGQIGLLGRLKTFNVANNHLSGPVPIFFHATFPADSYANNLGLCGYPLDRCKTYERKFHKFDYSFKSGLVIGYVIFAVSSAVVFLAYCVPWFHVGNKNKRMAIAEFVVLIMTMKRNRIKNNVVHDEEQKNSLQTVRLKPQETKKEMYNLEKIITRMSFADLKNATKNFCSNDIIGVGRTGTVYKARLSNGWFIAVKRFHDCQDSNDLLITELKTLGRFRHYSLLPLVGFCIESKERLLVYKYMSNGNLSDWLHSADGEKSILEWSIRLRIATGLASGLAWLHHGCNFRIAHQNISSKSVLLNQNFEPKLSNFEKAMFLDNDSSNSFSVDSGFWDWGFVKRDVFNFGVVLLELITRKQLSSANSSDGRINELISSFSSSSCCMYDAIDKSIIRQGNDGDIFQLLRIASTCVQPSPEKRPSMLDVCKSIAEIGNRFGHTESSKFQTGYAAASFRKEHTEIEIEEMS